MKILNGKELAGFVKERQAQVVRSLQAQKIFPKLVIVRDSENPVIKKYVDLKRQYGSDIGVVVSDILAYSTNNAKASVVAAGKDESVHGIIVQLPLKERERTDEVVQKIVQKKDVDGLSGKGKFDSATATAINWLLSGHGIELNDKKIAIVGRGRLVGAPLIKMWNASGYDITVFGHDADLSVLPNFDVIVSATGVPHLIKSEMVAPGAVVVDAGTASEDGVLVGDVDEAVRRRTDLAAITPRIGGVGPLTVGVLFENVINSAITKAQRDGKLAS